MCIRDSSAIRRRPSGPEQLDRDRQHGHADQGVQDPPGGLAGDCLLYTSSPEWKEQVGEGKAVKWPVGQGGKGNEGVAAYVGQLKNSIGYVEYAYACLLYTSRCV